MKTLKKHQFFIIWLCSALLLASSGICSGQYIKGIFFHPQANLNAAGNGAGTSHTRFMVDFEEMIVQLAAKGINTIVFDAHNLAYKFASDSKLTGIWYPPGGGFTPYEMRNMAAIARSKGMKVMVSIQILTHQEWGALSRAHPEYMVPEKNWTPGTQYDYSDFVEISGKIYYCTNYHLSSTENKPESGPLWSTCWSLSGRSIRDPFNLAGEQLIFKMIDELISVFTVNSVKPDGFHIASDEGWSFLNLNCPGGCEGKSYAETFAMVVSNVYNHIKKSNPEMDVMIWSDMLDSLWNGGTYKTSGAIDLIPKNIIIADWRYEKSSTFRYDSEKGLFVSIQEFADKGFTVWPSGWMDADASAALIWSGNMAEAKGANIYGHLYTTWFGGAVPELVKAFKNPDDTTITAYARGVAHAIDSTSNLVGLKLCPQNNFLCGTYPDCNNCNDLDGIYGNEFRDYFCNNDKCEYSVVAYPDDCISYWDFEGDANDRRATNHGKLKNGAAIVTEGQRGNVLSLDGTNDYVYMPDSETLDMTENLTLSLWFNIADTLPDRQTLAGKNYLEYEIMIYSENFIHTYSSNGTGSYDEGIIAYITPLQWTPNRWYHILWSMDGKKEAIYLDGKLIEETSRKTFNGTLPGANEFNIGRRTNGNYYFKGLIDDVMIFNHAISAPEALYIYEHQKPQTTGVSVLNIYRHGLSVFPNPSASSVFFKFNLDQNNKVQLKIYDTNGKLVKEILNKFMVAGEYNVEWNTKEFEQGIYFVEYISGAIKQSEKIVKIR